MCTAATVVVTANAENDKEGDDHKPNDLVIEKFAKAVHIIPDVLSSFYDLKLQGLIASTLTYYDEEGAIATV